MKLVLAFVLGGLLAAGLCMTQFVRNPQLQRAPNGVTLGGYVLPDALGRLDVVAVRYGIDSAIFDIRVDDCPSLTFWDVSLSGTARGENSVEFPEAPDAPVLRYQTSQARGFLYRSGVNFFTSVRVDDVDARPCVAAALGEIFGTARPAYSQPETVQ